ncbi:MAG TPA: response regulator [Bacteroidales bacterium]|nr:response regulator [Bacteroidales bacterium]
METKKILIVDDDIDVITIIETILKKEGYIVIAANDKIEGMKKIREEKPDLAILDVMMTTHYEGFELAKEITDDPELSKMPVLMQTSIDILTTTKPDVQAMAREFRKNPGFKDLHVILVKDINTGKAGVDYLSEDGKSIWFPVDGFIRKPVDVKRLLPELTRILGEKQI